MVPASDTQNQNCTSLTRPASRWAQAWTGTAVDFKPGSMALFDFDVHGGRIGSASLLFYAHPKALKFLGPSYKE